MQTRVQPVGNDQRDFEFHLQWLQRMRSDRLQQSQLCGRRACRMHHLISALVFAGFVKDTQHFQE
eukprot:4993356-Alexandrium_andersonii.AAC.1